MAAAGSVIQSYVERSFGRFAHLRGKADPPLTPWTPISKAGIARLAEHLERHYGMVIKRVRQLDSGVYQVVPADGSSWVARAFPPARALDSTEQDAAVLAFLADQDFPSERLAHAEPVSVVDDHAVLVTEHVAGKSPGATGAVGSWLGDALGRLHTLEMPGTVSRVGGGWHGLSLDGGGRTADLSILRELLADLRKVVAPRERKAVDALRAALDTLDLCEGLPQALVHVDFGGPNLLKSPDGSFTVIDWTGAGPGPRIESVAGSLGHLPPTARRAAIRAYRRHVEPTVEELDRLEGTLLTHRLVLACWGVTMVPAQLQGIADQLREAGPKLRAAADAIRREFVFTTT